MKYPAVITREGQNILAEFPDCPGCQTFTEKGRDLGLEAQEALEGWLEAHLLDGESPPRPSSVSRRGKQVVQVGISPGLALRLQLRWARQDAHLSQEEVAQRAGVSQQAIAKLEQRDSNPTVGTLFRVAQALNAHFDVVLESRPRRKVVVVRRPGALRKLAKL